MSIRSKEFLTMFTSNNGCLDVSYNYPDYFHGHDEPTVILALGSARKTTYPATLVYSFVLMIFPG